MPLPVIRGIAHVELTVRDLDRSEAWYARVLGMVRAWEGRDDVRRITARALVEPQSRTVLGLTQHQDADGTRFDMRRPGLDHLAFAVADRAALQEWQAHLMALGTDFTPVEEWSHGAGLTVRDPDGIALEFYVRGPQPG